MTAGVIPALLTLTLGPAEKQGGYSSKPTDGGSDANAALQSAVLDLQAAALKCSMIVSALPPGANKTALTAAMNALTAVS